MLPGNLDARLAIVRGLLAAKDLERAEKELATLQAARPQAAVVHVQVGVLASQKGNVAAARTAFERALALDATSLEAVAGLLSLDLRARDFPAARALVERSLDNDHASPQGLLLAARTYASLNDLAAAERSLRRAIEADPTLLPAYRMLGQLYLSQRKLDEARKEFDALAQRQSKPVAALTMAGIVLQAQGNTAQARQRFEQALALDPHASVAANNLAWIHTEKGGDLNTALQLALAATAATPDVPEMMDTLGWVYYKKEQPKLAIPLLTRSVEKAATNPVYHYHLGLAYIQDGNFAAGRRSLQRALTARPDAETTADIKKLLGETTH
jgi:tetratricopeptide (TPR) repeat protein